ncbi:MAG TPA: adenine phosphoribosyltransferase [bacterium]
MIDLKKIIREIPDYPKKGILFYDITTLLKDAKAFQKIVDILGNRYVDKKIDLIVGIDARGFIIGAALAYKLGKGLVLVRKKGKLPYKTIRASYQLEYGADEIEMHQDAVTKGQSVIIVDDLLATGGTAAATVELVEKSGGKVKECVFIIELEGLKGRDKLESVPVFSLLKYT